MAFYLKLLEIYNTQGQPPPQTPAPGVALSGCCCLPDCHAPRYAVITMIYARFATLYFHFAPLQCCKSPIIPLTRA